MKRTDIVIITSMTLSGLILYAVTCKLMGYQIFSNQKEVVEYNAPIKTGHEGETLPSINILLSDSTTHFNIKDAQGSHPIVLFFFGPDCPYCHQQITEIIHEIEHLRNIDFYLITTVPYKEMKRFYTLFGLNQYSNIIVGVDYGFQFSRYFNTQSIPYIVMYDRLRTLKAAYIGNVKYSQFKEILQ